MKDTPFQRLISTELARLHMVHAIDQYALAHTTVHAERPVRSKWYTALLGKQKRKTTFSFEKLLSLAFF